MCGFFCTFAGTTHNIMIQDIAGLSQNIKSMIQEAQLSRGEIAALLGNIAKDTEIYACELDPHNLMLSLYNHLHENSERWPKFLESLGSPEDIHIDLHEDGVFASLIITFRYKGHRIDLYLACDVEEDSELSYEYFFDLAFGETMEAYKDYEELRPRIEAKLPADNMGDFFVIHSSEENLLNDFTKILDAIESEL